MYAISTLLLVVHKAFRVHNYATVHAWCVNLSDYMGYAVMLIEWGWSACRTFLNIRVLLDFKSLNPNTVRPLLLLSGHPPLSGHFPKSRFVCQYTVVFDTSIQRPPLLSGHGHLFAVASVLFIWFLTSIERPADYLSKHFSDYFN